MPAALPAAAGPPPPSDRAANCTPGLDRELFLDIRRLGERAGTPAARSEKHAAIEDHRGVVVIGHAQFLGTGEAGEGNLARRRLPRTPICTPPAVLAPTRTAGQILKGWALVMTDGGRRH